MPASMINYQWLTKQATRRRSFDASSFPRQVKAEVLTDDQLAGNMIQLMECRKESLASEASINEANTEQEESMQDQQ